MITLNFDEVLKRIYNAKKGVEVRYGLGQGFEYCKQFADEAQGYATNAKASADKAEQTVAGIEQTKTDAVQAVQNAQSTATTAVQQAQSTATNAVTTKQAEAVQAVDDERDAALQQVADSTQVAQTAASNAAASEQEAQASKEAAATSAGAAANSATAASGSARAAATSESNAASSAQSASTDADRAEAAANLAGTRAGTDKALNTENAPADAAVVGKAFASIIKAYDIALAAASWKATSDTAAKNAGLAYQCDATVSGCTAALEPSATVSLESVVVAQKAGLGSICSTGAGFCRFYAEKVPTEAIGLRLLLTNKNPV
jgi:hypothetical protein